MKWLLHNLVPSYIKHFLREHFLNFLALQKCHMILQYMKCDNIKVCKAYLVYVSIENIR